MLEKWRNISVYFRVKRQNFKGLKALFPVTPYAELAMSDSQRNPIHNGTLKSQQLCYLDMNV